MTRALIILAEVVIIGVSGAAGFWLFKPELVPGMEKSRDVTPAFSASETAAAQGRNDRLTENLRLLGATQDRIVQGNSAASGDQHHLIEEIAEDYEKIDFAKSPVAPNFEDILVYVLSGGEPDVLQTFIDNSSASDSQKNLAKGVLSFLAGDEKDGIEHLRNLELLTLSPQLIGPMALAKASLEATSDTARALDFLDIARLSSPHTAVEEAAMRREILLLLRQKTMGRALALMADYLRRFSKSAFRPGFVKEFAKYIVEHDASNSRETVAVFSEAIEDVEASARADVLLALAQGFLSKGKVEAAQAASAACLKAEKLDVAVKARAQLYIAAANAPSVQAASSKQSLLELAVSDTDLSKDDADLRTAAIQIADGVVAGAVGQAQPRDSTPPLYSTSGEDDTVKAIKPTLDRASAILRTTDEIVREAP